MSKTIATILSLNDKMSPKLVGISAKVAGMSKEMQRASKQSANMANNMGKSMLKATDKVVKATMKWAALGALGGAGIIFKVGIDGLKELDEVAAKIKSISTGVAANKTNVEAGLLNTSNKTGIGVKEIGTTQYDAISSGVSEKNSLGAAVVAAKLAKSGFTDSDSALKVLMSTMNVYGLVGTKAMTNISDKMLVVQNLGVITVAEMAESMGSVTPVAQACGSSIDELDAGMISLTKNGVKADEASVQMKGIFTSIIKPSKEAADTASALGLNFSAAGLKAKGFAGFMAEVKQKTGGNVAIMGKLFGDVRALTGALVLSGPGFDDFNAGLLALRKSGGLTESAYATMTNTIGAKWDKLKNRLKNASTSIVATQSGALGKLADSAVTWMNKNQGNIEKWINNVGVALTKIINFIGKIIDFVVKHHDAIGNFALAFASFYIAIKAVMALKVAFDVCKVAWGLLNGELVLTPLGWIIIVIAAVIFACVKLYQHWDTVKAKTKQCWQAFKDNPFAQFAILCIPVVGVLVDIAAHFDKIKAAIQGVVDWMDEMNGAKPVEASDLVPKKHVPIAEKTTVGAFLNTSTIKAKKVPKKIPSILDKYTKYASGGIATKASIFGEAGNEIAIPLKKTARSKALVTQADNIVNGKNDKGNVFIININNPIGEQEFFDKAGTHIVKQVKLALSNV